MKMVWRALVAVLLGAGMLPLLSSAAHADTTSYTISGKVTGLNASNAEVGIGGVSVWAESSASANTDDVDVSAVTAADGTYSIAVPRTGDYSFFVYCDSGCTGYDDTRADDASVTGNTTENFHLSLLTTLTLTIDDSASQPITRPLDVQGFSGAGDGSAITVTGPTAAGSYTLTNVSADSDISVYDDLSGDPVYVSWDTYDHPGFVTDSASPQSQTITLADWTGIRATAVAPDGTPLANVRWNVFTQDPTTGAWDDGLQEGPLLTDSDGSMTDQVDPGANYKLCFYDDDYSANTRTQRYADTCYNDAATEADATPWTPTDAEPVLDTTVTMQPDGLSLSPGTPWIDGSVVAGQPLTVDPGTWGPSGVALTYQWVAADSTGLHPIAGATSATYTPTDAQAGETIEVEVTGTLSGYRSATSGALGGVVGGTGPTMTGSLTITGTPAVGNTLTAVPGTLAPTGVNVVYDWLVNGQEDYADVSGDDGNVLTVTPAMAGATIEVHMTAYDWDYGNNEYFASAQELIPGGTLTSATPTITGTTTVGSTLTAHPGTWGPAGVALAYQWYRAGTAISGATAATYKLVAADAAKALTVKVTGTLAGYQTVTTTSTATAAVQNVFTTAPVPTITGTKAVGSTLTANPGTWAPAPTISYQWYRAGAAISGAKAKTYKLVAADRAKAITVRVGAARSGYVTTYKTSAATAAILGVFSAPTPIITGTVVQGYTLTAKTGTWSPAPTKMTYQWYRAGKAISGAKARTYKLVAADAGKAITVHVTGTRAGYVSKALAAKATKAVLHVFAKAPKPTIAGTKKVGDTLTAKAGTWSPKATFTYQWYRAGKAISGATGKTHKLVAADKGKHLSVRVKATRSGYLAVTKTSAATALIG